MLIGLCECKNSIVDLDKRLIFIGKGKTHHGAAVKYLADIVSTAERKYLGSRSAYCRTVISTLVPYSAAVNGDPLGNKGIPVLMYRIRKPTVDTFITITP